jgi:hypothetical protein
MKKYNIFKHENYYLEAVKKGWSWPAFFFVPIWAMLKKMWGLGVGVFIGELLLYVIVVLDAVINRRPGGEGLLRIAGIIIMVIFGGNGNSWREKNLVSRGFEQVDTVTAESPEHALALYLKNANQKDS